ncbi:MAG: DUF642 domain-containing protein [Cyanobacteriota bacterium]|nr:DUF642 domain-containing protein [Cyanobacteriota bacterium]
MLITKKISIAIVGIAVTTLMPGGRAQAANLVKNGDFEAVDIGGSWTTYNATTVPRDFGWSVSNDFFYLVNSYWGGISGTSNPDGFDQSLELRPTAILSQQFSTQVGQTYELSFYYAHDPFNQNGWATGHFSVTGTNSLLSNTLTHNLPSSRADLNFLKYITQFTADSEITTLSFRGDLSNNIHGFVIDGVSVLQTNTTIPEPNSALSLLTLGISVAGFGLKRKQP